MDNCIICLEPNDNFSRITTTSIEWIEGSIQQIIEKHLWWWYLKPTYPSNGRARWICRQCWQEISTFNKFYCKVEMVHRYYRAAHSPLEKPNCEQQEGGTIVVKHETEYTVETPSSDLVLSKKRRRGRPRKHARNMEKAVIENVPEVEIKSEFFLTTNEGSGKQVYDDDNLINNTVGNAISFDDEGTQNFEDFKVDFNALESEDEKPLKNNVNKVKRSEKAKRKEKVKQLQKKLNPNKTVKIKDNSQRKIDDFFKDKEHKLECCICNVPLTDFRTLKHHYRNEHTTRGYAMCCSKKYFKRCLLVDHLRVHTDPNYFKCQSCTKTFATRRGLEMHLESHQSRERKYNCEDCGKSYFNLHVFERHKLTHVPESERNFSCSQCNKKFGSDYLRRQHEDLTHAKKYAKICDICGRTFCHSYSFARHMEEHAGAPPSMETCEICGVKLTNKYGLRQHMKMRHVEENLQEQICPYCSKVSPNLNAHRMHIKYTHTMQRTHACHLCNKAFKRPLELKEHLSTHTGEALYTCPHCPRTFISNANMHKHRKIAHRREWEESRLKKLKESGRKAVDVTATIANGKQTVQKGSTNLMFATTEESGQIPNFLKIKMKRIG